MDLSRGRRLLKLAQHRKIQYNNGGRIWNVTESEAVDPPVVLNNERNLPCNSGSSSNDDFVIEWLQTAVGGSVEEVIMEELNHPLEDPILDPLFQEAINVNDNEWLHAAVVVGSEEEFPLEEKNNNIKDPIHETDAIATDINKTDLNSQAIETDSNAKSKINNDKTDRNSPTHVLINDHVDPDITTELPEASDEVVTDPNWEPEDESEQERLSVENKKKKNKKNSEKKNKEKPVLEPCRETCRMKCREKFSLKNREEINSRFWRLKFAERRLFLDKHVKQTAIKVRKTSASDASKRQTSCVYSLQQDTVVEESLSETGIEDKIKTVCKTMFLHTLGLKSDGMITGFLRSKRKNSGSVDLTDKRGATHAAIEKKKQEKLDEDIKNHINSFRPQVSHYKIEHAPLRRYLPSDNTVRSMWRLYINDQKTKKKVTYQKYRTVFKKENIGFDTPSQDDCGVCSLWHNHMRENEHESTTGCEDCRKYEIHKDHYTQARIEYRKDTDTKWSNEHAVYTVDMQKVLIIPKMTIKNSFFVSRLVVFNETFAPIFTSTNENVCVLWHEAISGRTAADVASAYFALIKKSPPEVQHFLFWADNCSAQNKNWILFTSFITLLKSEWAPESITIKYFEPGHSFMKADSVHGGIGKAWKAAKEILDMDDLTNLIENADRRNKVQHLREFYEFKSAANAKCNVRLQEIKEVRFVKKNRRMFYKTRNNQSEYFSEDFLKKTFKGVMPGKKDDCRGMNQDKLKKIKKELLPHMPPRKRIFWNEMKSSQVDDLYNF